MGLLPKSIQRAVDSPQSTAYIKITVIWCRVPRPDTTIRVEFFYFGNSAFKNHYNSSFIIQHSVL